MANQTTSDRSFQDDTIYKLPNDAPEHARLDTQAAAISALMQDSIFRAPLDKPQRILDVGCGTGLVTIELGRKFTDAEVIGVDISPVPAGADIPSNVQFLRGDIKDFAEDADSPVGSGGFDYIFSRLLVAGNTDWPNHVARLTALLAPGGWIELHDVDLVKRHPDTGTASLSSEQPFYAALLDDMRTSGADPEIGRHLLSHLSSQDSLTGSQEEVYRWLWTPDPSYPQGEKLGIYCHAVFVPFCSMLFDKFSSSLRSADEIQAFKEELAAYAKDIKVGTHMTFFVAWAQKKAEV